ncbi:MAG: hypothetical protein M3O28_07635 [Actinomycetota bacterium]|nr:hypothetical protein [Actinomycetota bacterium]
MSSHAYDVVVTREEQGDWVGAVPAEAGVRVAVRTLAKLDGKVRDVLARRLETKPAALNLNFKMGAAFTPASLAALEDYQAADAAYARARTEYDNAQRDAIEKLQAEGVSLRDCAHLVGLSFQRLQEIAARALREASL